MSNAIDFTIPEDTLSWLNSLPPRQPAPNTRRGPSRSSTYHELDSKYALRVQHNRRYSLATPPVVPPRITEEGRPISEDDCEKQGPNLMDMPTEILDTIIGYVITPSAQSDPVITVKRNESESACTAADIESGHVVRKWDISGYPSALFLVNHTISATAFHRVWADSAVNISLSSADALCFLKYALSERQRVAMRRVRFSKIMLSWADPVGKDVWLREGARDGKTAPGFVQEEERKRAAVEEATPTISRMQSLVGLLQTRSSPALGLVVS